MGNVIVNVMETDAVFWWATIFCREGGEVQCSATCNVVVNAKSDVTKEPLCKGSGCLFLIWSLNAGLDVLLLAES